MADRPPDRAGRVSLAIDADLQVDDPWGRSMAITVRDSRGTIDVRRAALRYCSLRALRALLRYRAHRGAGMRRVLGASGLTIEVKCEGRTIGMISGTSAGHWLARLLRLGPMEIRLLGVLAALVLPAPAPAPTTGSG